MKRYLRSANTVFAAPVLLFCVLSLSACSSGEEYIRIGVDEYQQKVYASWLGQIIGNIYGLPHENQHIEKPGPDAFPYGYEVQNPDPADYIHGYRTMLGQVREIGGAFSDDDTDFEYLYLLQMEKYGPEPSYADLKGAWLHHVRDRVWLANRGALGLMHFGFDPPVSGMKDYNPHWFQIDPQLVNEIWAVTAPGMIRYAVQKSEWAARITNDGWGVEPTMFYGALYAGAFFESDVERLIDMALEVMPAGSRFSRTVEHMKELYKKYPDDWQAARAEMAKAYYDDEPVDTRTIWNANLNGAAGILALLYGQGDFQRTLDLACAMGFDADNQAATMSGLMGIVVGLDGIPHDLLYPVEGWTKPFNDFYKNVSRHDVPDASIEDMARRMAEQGEKIILAKGGKRITEDGKDYYLIPKNATFVPPFELPNAPAPYLVKGEEAAYEFLVSGGEGKISWELASGELPAGLQFANGRLSGVPEAAGVFPVTIRATSGASQVEKSIPLVVRESNLAPEAASVIASVRRTNTEVRDKMWLTVGRSLYVDDVEAIRDGIKVGDGSTFYSITDSSAPREDYYGYEWSEPREVGLIGFHTGAMEESGGWFTSLGVEYRDQSGGWKSVENLIVTPALAPGAEPYNKPHFVEYLLAFEPVETTAIRIKGTAGGVGHWYNDRTYFTSISELTAHGPLPNYQALANGN